MWLAAILAVAGLAVGTGLSWEAIGARYWAYRLGQGDSAAAARLKAVGPVAIPALLDLIEHSDPPGAAFRKVPAAGGGSKIEAVRPIEEMPARRAARFLAGLGSPAEDALLDRLARNRGNPRRGARLVSALRCFKSGRARAAYREALLDEELTSSGLSLYEGSAGEAARLYLALRQEPDGRWSAKKSGAEGASDLEVTSLVVLSFLGHGYTPQAGVYREQVARGLRFIMSRQGKDGRLGAGPMREHARAGLALSEAYGMTKSPTWKGPARRAADWTVRKQIPCGGWVDKKSEKGDALTTALCVFQLKSARLAGLKMEIKAFQGALNCLQTLTVKEGVQKYLVRPRADEAPTLLSVTAGAGAKCQMGVSNTDPEVWRAADHLIVNFSKAKSCPLQAMMGYWLCFYVGRGRWTNWEKPCLAYIHGSQEISGPHAGSWPLESPEARRLGRVGTTALRLLPLAISYYCYKPMYGALPSAPLPPAPLAR